MFLNRKKVYVNQNGDSLNAQKLENIHNQVRQQGVQVVETLDSSGKKLHVSASNGYQTTYEVRDAVGSYTPPIMMHEKGSKWTC